MAALPVEDAWMEKALVAIAKRGGSDVKFHALVEDITISGGEKDIEGVPLVNGGRVRKWSPQSDFTIEMTAYCLAAGTDTGTDAEGLYDLMHTADTSAPVRITNDFTRSLFRVAVLFTNDTTVTSAVSATTDTYMAFRQVFAEVVFTNVSWEFTGDKLLKFTFTGKCTPFDKGAVANVVFESCQGASGTDILPAIAAYTTSNKFA